MFGELRVIDYCLYKTCWSNVLAKRQFLIGKIRERGEGSSEQTSLKTPGDQRNIWLVISYILVAHSSNLLLLQRNNVVHCKDASMKIMVLKTELLFERSTKLLNQLSQY